MNERALILVVDDAPRNLLLLTSILQPLGEVVATNSLPEAQHVLAGGRAPDVVLLDAGLGPEHEDPWLAHKIPVIPMLASGASGVDSSGVIARPLHPERVTEVVRERLRLAGLPCSSAGRSGFWSRCVLPKLELAAWAGSEQFFWECRFVDDLWLHLAVGLCSEGEPSELSTATLQIDSGEVRVTATPALAPLLLKNGQFQALGGERVQLAGGQSLLLCSGEESWREEVCRSLAAAPDPEQLMSMLRELESGCGGAILLATARLPQEDVLRIQVSECSELDRVNLWLAEALARWGYGSELLQDFELVAEEVIVNVLTHSHCESGELQLEVSLGRVPGGLELVFSDNGVEYDPLLERGPRTEDQIGGWGIPILKALMQRQSYSRTQGRNVLTLIRLENTAEV